VSPGTRDRDTLRTSLLRALLAGAAASLLVLAIHEAAIGPSLVWGFWLRGFAGATALGLVSGSVVEFSIRGLQLIPGLARPITVAAGSVALWMIPLHALQVLERFGTPYEGLAFAVTLVCASAALATYVALRLATAEPAEFDSLGRLPSWLRRTTAPAALLLLFSDAWLYSYSYDVAHWALEIAAFVLLFAFFRPIPVRRPALVLAPLVAAGLLAGGVFAFVAPTADASHAIDRNRVARAITASLRAATDWDRDGHSTLFGGADCDAFDPAVHPGALDVPGNGVDENCMAGDATRAPLLPVKVRHTVPSPRSIVLITVDALRPDYLGAYGSDRGLSPVLDGWARRGLVFENAFTAGGWTVVALPTMLRGAYARRLQWVAHHESTQFELFPIPPGAPSGTAIRAVVPLPANDDRGQLSSWLARRGMTTHAVIDDGFVHYLSPRHGMATGFINYQYADDEPWAGTGDVGVVDAAISILKAKGETERFFLWTHLFGTHFPYLSRPGCTSRNGRALDLYEQQVCQTDQELGRLLATVEERHPSAAVFVAGDHGERFDGGTPMHGFNLLPEIVRIPLIARVPAWPSGKSSVLCTLVDLAPTILALSGTTPSSGLDGIDLGLLVPGVAEGTSPNRVIFADTFRFDGRGKAIADWAGAMAGDRVVVFNLLSGVFLRGSLQRGHPYEPFDPAPGDHLADALVSYLESTGGTLQILK